MSSLGLGMALSRRASFAPASPYLWRDLANRYADGAVLNGALPLIGSSAWKTTGASLPTTSGGKFVNAGTGYLFANIGIAPATLGCRVTFSGATQSMTMAASNQTPPNLTIKQLAHHNFGASGFTLGAFDASGAFSTVLPGNWSAPLVGEGEFRVGLVNGSVIVIKGPSGETFAINDPVLAAFWGQMIFFEPTGGVNQVSEVYALRAALSYPGPTTFNPNDARNVSLSNGNLTVANAGSSFTQSVRSIAGRTNGKAHVEFHIDAHASATSDNIQIGFASLSQWNMATSGLGDDLKGLALAPRGAATGIWAKNAYQVSGLNISGAAGTDIGMETDFDNGLVSFCDITNGGAWTPPYAFGSAGIGGAPFGIAVNIQGGNPDAVTINAGGSPWLRAPSVGFGNWL